MKKIIAHLFLFCSIVSLPCFSQTNRVLNIFPKGTVLHANIAYNNDTLHKRQLDIYLPANAKGKLPLVVFIHGGAWLVNDKYADMGYMKKTLQEILNNGFALASIDYRFSTQATFPAQIQDCNRAVSFLYDNAEKFGLDRERFAVMGFSAGGHLASLLGLSKNNDVEDFFMQNTPVARPDLAKKASPVTYVDKGDPPFLIIHGEKDDMVSPKQSALLSSWLRLSAVPNELVIVKDAPHYGEMFDADEVRSKVMDFLKKELRIESATR